MSMSVARRSGLQKAQPMVTGSLGSPRWLVYYYLVQIVCQLALLTSWLASLRMIFRTSSYGMSLLALVATMGQRPARDRRGLFTAVVIIAILCLEALNPETSGALPALATIAIYIAILGPLFWVPKLAIDISWFRRIVMIIWAFQSLSALVGTLQVYFPGVFQPAIATVLSDSYVSSLQITLSNGETILRPTGLTDAPGAAAVAGTYTIILALGLWSQEAKIWFRALLASSIAVGLFVLYVCQVRAFVVMVAISIVGMGIVHAANGRVKKLTEISIVMGAIGVVAFLAAVSVGGEDVTRRLTTLIERSPTDVYYTNRGIFLEQTISELLPKYPLGAGLGRWGTVASYFGADRKSLIYVEIQWTGWLLDGGLLLIIVYTALLLAVLWSVWKIATRARHGEQDLTGWATMLVGYDIGTIALSFNFPVFMSEFGMDFWVLNAALIAIAASQSDQRNSEITSDDPAIDSSERSNRAGPSRAAHVLTMPK